MDPLEKLLQENRAAANRLHHLSMRYAAAFMELAQGHEIGLIPAGQPGLKEFRDLTDLILFTRAEVNAFTKLLVDAKIVTTEQVTKAITEEYDWFAKQKAKQFGIEVSDAGLVYPGGGKKT